MTEFVKVWKKKLYDLNSINILSGKQQQVQELTQIAKQFLVECEFESMLVLFLNVSQIKTVNSNFFSHKLRWHTHSIERFLKSGARASEQTLITK